MRIALFTETFLPKIDGVVNTLCYLLQHLERSGHQALLFAPEGAPETYAGARVIGIKGRGLPVYPELKMVNPLTDVSAELSAFQPDLVHVANPFFLGVAGVRTAKKMGLPLVASYHTDIPGYCRRYGFSLLERPAWSYIRWLHNRAALNLCPSSVTLAELQEQRVQHLKVWTRGVDTGQFSPEWRSEETRAALSDGEVHKPLLLYVGRLAAEKRVDWLADVIEAMPHVRLAIAGMGPEEEKLRARLAGTPTVFAGQMSKSELARAYASSDLFVFPSANETFGNVVLEAGACGLPTVTADAGGVTDIITHERNGLLFPAESRSEFVAAVRRVIDDDVLAADLSRAARDFALSRSWKAVLDGLLEDYAHVIATSASPRPAA
jgi:phosphatidylinositol alpha 1,6-mannosyltransferase